MSAPLTPEQIDYFKIHGYLILENLIDESPIAHWRSLAWRALGSRLDTPETWHRDKYVIDGFQDEPPESAFGRYPALAAIIDQVGGGDFEGGGGSPLVVWPDLDKPWQGRTSGHVDAYGPGGWTPFMIGATTYLYDVEPRGGGFTFWPDSHLTGHRYFLEHPSQVDGSFRDIEGWSWDVFNRGAGEPQEFTGQAGSVILWHAYLTHGGSMNSRPSPRFGLFARWSHKRHKEKDFRYEIPGDLWKYWAI